MPRRSRSSWRKRSKSPKTVGATLDPKTEGATLNPKTEGATLDPKCEEAEPGLSWGQQQLAIIARETEDGNRPVSW